MLLVVLVFREHRMVLYPVSVYLPLYLVVSAPTLTEAQCGLLLGLKRHPEQVSGLLPVEYRDRFTPELCAPATLEDMMVYLEREALR